MGGGGGLLSAMAQSSPKSDPNGIAHMTRQYQSPNSSPSHVSTLSRRSRDHLIRRPEQDHSPKVKPHRTPLGCCATQLLRRMPPGLLLLLITVAGMVIWSLAKSIKITQWGSESSSSRRTSIQSALSCTGLRWGPCALSESPSLSTSRLAIFTLPLHFSESSLSLYKTTLQSWLRLQEPFGTPQLYLIGNHSSLYTLARLDPEHIQVQADVDTNMEGVPQLHSVLARVAALSQESDLTLLVDPTVVLFPDLLSAANKVASKFPSWLIAGGSWALPRRTQDVLISELVRIQQSGVGTEALSQLQDMHSLVREKGRLQMRSEGVSTFSSLSFLMWKSSPWPLLPFAVPPFAMGRGSYEEWLMHHLAQASAASDPGAGGRQVVDVTDTVASVRLTIRSSSESEGVFGALVSFGGGGKSRGLLDDEMLSPKSWEVFANAHMASNFGTFSEGQGTLSHLPWRLTRCYSHAPSRSASQSQESSAEALGVVKASQVAPSEMCFLRRLRPGNCSCEHSPAVAKSSRDVRLHLGVGWTCGRVDKDQFDYHIDPFPKRANTLTSAVDNPSATSADGDGDSFPHTLEQLLPRVADEHHTVILVAVSRSFADMALTFVCMLRQLGVKNYLIAALDEAMYRYAFIQGLPVYFAGHTPKQPLRKPATFAAKKKQTKPMGENGMGRPPAKGFFFKGTGKAYSAGKTFFTKAAGRVFPRKTGGIVYSTRSTGKVLYAKARGKGFSSRSTGTTVSIAGESGPGEVGFRKNQGRASSRSTAANLFTETQRDPRPIASAKLTVTGRVTDTGAGIKTGREAWAMGGSSSRSHRGQVLYKTSKQMLYKKRTRGLQSVSLEEDESECRRDCLHRRLLSSSSSSTSSSTSSSSRREGGSSSSRSSNEGSSRSSSVNTRMHLRTEVVLRILKLGYNVLHSDPDIVWFKDPQPYLRSLHPNALLVQSNEPLEGAAPNSLRRINAGFFLARAQSPTIEAFEAIVAGALEAGAGSEQATMYDILCGEKGEYKVSTDACKWPTSQLDVVFLDRKLFPNGAVYQLWDSEDITKDCNRQGCYILHNNYITGKIQKMERMRRKGFHYFDPILRMCKWSWLRPNGIEMTS